MNLLYNILLYKNPRMWPENTQIPRGGDSSSQFLQSMEPQAARPRESLFWVKDSSLLSTRPITSVPGEISISTRDSFDLSLLLTKADPIKESPRDTSWNSTFGRLSNSQSVSRTYSNNCYEYEDNSNSSTNLPQSISNFLPQNQSSECNKPDPSKFYDNIIKDAMSGNSFEDSSNLKARRLLSKASLLAASALATTTKSSYRKAWG